MDSADLNDWLTWQQGVNPREIELGLDRITELLSRLGLTLPRAIMTVGGTNGKGSTIALLESLLTTLGHSVGAYTSPHLIRYNERIRLRGQPADDQAIVEAFRRIEAVRESIPLTFFEFGTLAALCVFDAARPDIALLEVGLGGRLDAVNAVDPDGVIITSIGYDHQAWLGDDLETIGREKAGIMRADRPAVYAGEIPPKSIIRVAAKIRAQLYCRGRDYAFHDRGSTWEWSVPARRFTGLARPGLAGAHQIANAAAALMLLHTLGFLDGVDKADVDAGLGAASLPGRFQRVAESPDWIVDVAHNPDAAIALAGMLRATKSEGRTYALIGMLGDKDIAGTITPLLPEIDEWFAVDIDSGRAVRGATLAAEIANQTNRPCQFFADTGAAIASIQELTGPEDRVIVFGSFFLAGPILAGVGVIRDAAPAT